MHAEIAGTLKFPDYEEVISIVVFGEYERCATNLAEEFNRVRDSIIQGTFLSGQVGSGTVTVGANVIHTVVKP